MPLRWAHVICLGVFSFASLNAVATEKQWFQVRSPHFLVITDAGAKRGIEVARRCERMRAAFGVLMNHAHTHEPAPLLIFALDGQKEVDQTIRSQGSKSRHAGVFLPGTDESLILLDASGDPWHTLFHEYAHELLYTNTSSAVLTWFDEGFAEYFSTFEFRKNRIELGRVPLGELQFLRENGKLMRLSDLDRVDQDSDIYAHNGSAQAMFYAESWLLVHYLFDHQMIGRSEPFFEMLAAGVPLDDAVEKAFGTTASRFEQDLLAYARGEQFLYFSLPVAADPGNGVVQAEPVSAATASALLADVDWHCKREHARSEVQDVAAKYEALLRQEAGNATADRGRARALLDLGQFEESLRSVRQAQQLEPDNVLNHYALAQVLNATSAANSPVAARDAAQMQAATECLRLDPDFADCYRLNAAALARQGELDTAADMMQKAIVLNPRSESYRLELAGIQLKQHDYVPAVALLNELKNSHDPEIAKQAEFFLASDVVKKP